MTWGLKNGLIGHVLFRSEKAWLFDISILDPRLLFIIISYDKGKRRNMKNRLNR